MANWKISESDLDNQINRAKAAGAEALKNEPRAKAVRYSPTRRQVIVELTNGCSFIFPADKAQGLAGASNKDLAAVKILGKGSGAALGKTGCRSQHRIAGGGNFWQPCMDARDCTSRRCSHNTRQGRRCSCQWCKGWTS